jgi:hypothetical protein
MSGDGHGAAGPLEVWPRVNVLNAGRPFSVLYPVLILLAAAPLGLAPADSLPVAVGGALAITVVVWGSVYAPAGAVSREHRSVLELSATIAERLGVERPAAARAGPPAHARA